MTGMALMLMLYNDPQIASTRKMDQHRSQTKAIIASYTTILGLESPMRDKTLGPMLRLRAPMEAIPEQRLTAWTNAFQKTPERTELIEFPGAVSHGITDAHIQAAAFALETTTMRLI